MDRLTKGGTTLRCAVVSGTAVFSATIVAAAGSRSISCCPVAGVVAALVRRGIGRRSSIALVATLVTACSSSSSSGCRWGSGGGACLRKARERY